MANGLNRATLIGNVGKDPEIRAMQDGREVATFSLATSEVWRDKSSGEKRDRTEWHRIVVFAQPLVNLVKNHVHQGSKLLVEGSIQSRKWIEQSGTEKRVTEIVIQPYNGNILFLDSKEHSSFHNNNTHNAEPKQDHKRKNKSNFAEPSYPSDLDDEIPF